MESNLLGKKEFSTSAVKVGLKEYLALLYHDLFDYPLAQEELYFWSVGTEGRGGFSVEKTGPFYHLKGRSEIVLTRISRSRASREKWEKVVAAGKILSFIPSIKMVAVSGSLAMGASWEEDDIDLFIITSRKTLWVSRLLSFLILNLLKVPLRRAGDSQKNDKLCLNFWLTEGKLSLGGPQNIYTAHEIFQIRPLLDKENIAYRFLEANSWARNFFPNAIIDKRRDSRALWLRLGQEVATFFLRLFDYLSYRAQLWYMRKSRTSERVDREIAAFHPFDWDKTIANAFLQRVEGFTRRKERRVKYLSE